MQQVTVVKNLGYGVICEEHVGMNKIMRQCSRNWYGRKGKGNEWGISRVGEM